MMDRLEADVELNRRTAIRGLMAVSLAPAVLASLSACGEVLEDLAEAIRNRPTRRNVGNLAPDDPVIRTYIEGVTLMKALPASDPRNWANQANIHLNLCPHSNWLFLPWHRHYLYWFERIIRELTGEVSWALPYWNWIEDPAIPAVFLSGVLSHPRQSTSVSVPGATADTAMGETAFVNFGSGALAEGEPQRPASPKTKSTFERTVHDTVHGQIGNIADGMGGFRSPLDPIFWLHHNMIEYMWVEWNLGRGNLNPDAGHWGDYQFDGNFVDQTGTAVTGGTSSVGFSLLFPLLSYRFENSLVGTVAGTV